MTATHDQIGPVSGRAWAMVLIFCLAGFVSYTHRMILGVIVDPIRADLGLSDASVSLLQGAAFALVYVFAGLPLGRLADSGKRKGLMLAGAAIWCVGTICCGVAPSFWTLFAARALVGIGEAALSPAAVSMIGDTFPPHQRGFAIGVFLAGMIVGGPAAVGIGGMILGAAEAGDFAGWPIFGALAPWRVVLVLTGMLGLIVPLLLLTVKEPARHESIGAPPLSEVVRHILSDRHLLFALLIALALLSIGDYGLLSWSPATLERGFGWTPAQFGLPFTVITAAAGIVASLSGGWLTDYTLRKGGLRLALTMCAGFAVCGTLGALLISGDSPWMVLAGIGVWTLCSGISATAGIATLQIEMPNELRGIGVSLVAFCNTLLGLGGGPTLVALVTEHGFGDPAAVGHAITAVVVPGAILSALLYLVARRALATRPEVLRR